MADRVLPLRALGALALAAAVIAACAPVAKQPWRSETIALPPEFAPELEVRGVERLRFAPGMFDQASPDYFTYAFILVLEGSPPVDGNDLARFLELYFDGLMTTVAKERKVAVKVPRTKVGIIRSSKQHHWLATVHTVDAFGEGQPIVLNIRLRVSRSGPLTCVIALASPRPTSDKAIWSSLETQAAQLPCELDQ